jgi:capsular polysaccharide transport system permease protein
MSSQSSYPAAPATTGLLEPTLANNIGLMWRVIYGLMLRESRTRYGTSDIGYLWALIDPAAQLAMLWLIFDLLGRNPPVPCSMPVFLVTAILPYFFWRNCANRGASAASANLPLLTYPQVKVFDVVVARVLLDAATLVFVTAVFVITLRFTTGELFIHWVRDPFVLSTGIMALFYFAFCTSVLTSSLGRIWRAWPQFFSYVSRPLYFTSGIFFTLGQLPTSFKAVGIYNPIAHLLEWIRTGAIPGFISTSYNPYFPLIFASIMLFVGLFIDWVLRVIGHTEESH